MDENKEIGLRKGNMEVHSDHSYAVMKDGTALVLANPDFRSSLVSPFFFMTQNERPHKICSLLILPIGVILLSKKNSILTFKFYFPLNLLDCDSKAAICVSSEPSRIYSLIRLLYITGVVLIVSEYKSLHIFLADFSPNVLHALIS